MFRADLFRSGVDVRRPFDTIVHSHDELLPLFARMRELATLPPGLRRGDAAALARRIDDLLSGHHEDEEAELFPSVAQAARPGRRRALALRLAARLMEDHRHLEGLWRCLRPLLLAGSEHAVSALADDLAAAYRRHAAFEEERYLPFARRVMARKGNHLAAFGVSLHMRHLPAIPAYV